MVHLHICSMYSYIHTYTQTCAQTVNTELLLAIYFTIWHILFYLDFNYMQQQHPGISSIKQKYKKLLVRNFLPQEQVSRVSSRWQGAFERADSRDQMGCRDIWPIAPSTLLINNHCYSKYMSKLVYIDMFVYSFLLCKTKTIKKVSIN